ncbi:hypothetical protein KSMBR1_1707 [Candidatus Kuenenia stuttgartiensis]|uniref:Uncharacterized protein n=1 Tax=Kuenenia stuttgartiensis TaxID=174633 RepID=A0A2C9CEU3_KUEST|nr:hypothetical protein KSMBR1_1707 [Candidatus Kuenenia stuttgartiensis]
MLLLFKHLQLPCLIKIISLMPFLLTHPITTTCLILIFQTSESKEKKLLDGLLAGKERLRDEITK